VHGFGRLSLVQASRRSIVIADIVHNFAAVASSTSSS